MTGATALTLKSRNVLRIRTVWSDVQTFLKDLGLQSKNTETTYRTAIRDFFQTMCGKTLEQVTVDDLHFDHTDVLDYRMYLIEEKKMKVGSVNLKMSAIKRVMGFLARHEEYNFIRPETFATTKLKGEVDSYGDLSKEEAIQFIKQVKSQEKGEEKSLLFELATYTSIRRDALLNLEWRNFEVNDEMAIITTLDKGKKEDRKPIDIDFYNRLLAMKRDGEAKVFTLTRKTVNRSVRTVCEQLGITDERNIVFHSFKKVAINWILQNEGDVMKAARQGNHNLETMYKHYARMKENFSGMAGMNMGKEIDMSILAGMTAQQLLDIIHQSSVSTKLSLLEIARKF